MISEEDIQKKLEERIARAILRGFTREYQDEKEREDNNLCHSKLAPATLEKYNGALLNWVL
jgi:hypothetical protein